MTPEERLQAIGCELPPAPAPVGSYLPYVLSDDLVFTSGQLPMRAGKLAFAGKVGRDLTTERGSEAAKLAALNALSQVAAAAGGLSNVEQIVRLVVFVNSAEGFVAQPQVANGASDLMVAAFGDAGRHARSAVGVNELPLDSPVEVELIARVRR